MKLKIHTGDITKLNVDAIVNAANSSLLGGGGVDGAIHRAAGKELEFECRMLAGCKTGQSKLTKGYNLPANFIIHTVGPVWNNGLGSPEKLLENCYLTSLHIAHENSFETIAYPCISTGIYKFPKLEAAQIAVRSVKKFCEENETPSDVTFCCFLNEDANIYKDVFEDLGVLQ